MLVRNGALLMSVNAPEIVLDALPHAKLINFRGRDIVVAKHTLDTARVLNNLGLDAPTPMQYGGYNYTGRYTPTAKQLRTTDFFVLNKRRAYCFNKMRTGKTSAALWALDYLKNVGEISKVLVVSPVSVMDVWANELFTTLPHRDLIQLTGSASRRIKLAEESADIHVINFDGLRALYHEECYPNSRRVKHRSHDLEGKYDLIIADEASAYCNAQNERWKALNYLVKSDTNLWLLTATPTNNAPTDAFGLIKLMHPGRVPKSFKLFEETLMRQVGPYKKIPRDGALDKIYALMQPAIKFERDANTDLPTTMQNRHCEMSDMQKKVFEDIKTKMMHEAEEADITAANAAVKLVKLQQVMCGAVKDDAEGVLELNPNSRFATVLELVKEAGSKTVVFVPFKHSMKMLQEFLTKKKITSEIINGDVGKTERDKRLSAFTKQNTPQVLIAHPKVAAHGLDLTVADTFIWYAPTFSTEQYEQANARGEGPNKTRAVGIYHIGCHPVEWRIYDVLRSKVAMQSKLLDLYNSVLS